MNATPDGAGDAIRAVRDGGRLATITSDPPEQDRGITVSSVYVRPDAGQLGGLARLLAAGQLEISVATSYEFLDAADALATVVSGRAGGAVALTLLRTPDHYTCLAPSMPYRHMPISRASNADGRRPRNCDDLASATHAAPFNAGGAPRLPPAEQRHDGKVLDAPHTGTQPEAGAVSSAPARFAVRSTPWQASPLGRPRIGWVGEGLILEHDAARLSALPTLGPERRLLLPISGSSDRVPRQRSSLVTASKRMTMRSDEVWLASARGSRRGWLAHP